MRVPIIKLSLSDETISKVNDVLKSGIWAEYKNVHELEKEFAEYLNVKHVRAVNNGTSALLCSLFGLGIQPGDEVLVPSFTFIATANSILYFNAKPVFVDVNRDTFNISIDDLEKKITPKTSAIMPVHLYGLPANMDEINEIAKDKDLKVIEDACQAHGAIYKNKKCGALGNAGAFSLYPTKNMYCGGEGGLISTDDEKVYERIKLYSNHGQSAKYVHSSIGFNFRMQDANAVVARESLKELDSNNNKRRNNAKFYSESLENVDEIVVPVIPEGSQHVFHQYTLKVEKRDALANHLREHGVGFGIHYGIPVHLQESMKKRGLSTKLPVTEMLAKEVISLPIHPLLEKEQREYVVKQIKDFYS